MADVPDRLVAALEGRYRIERELGEGGMATVYLAEDLKHRRQVAIKVLRPELAAVLGADRFVQEITTTARLQHPHILPLYDSGTADSFLYYVMPYVEGESLRERLDREKQLGVEEAVRIAREVADALDYAHRHDIVHRDIKPANILLHDGRPMVADFGIALAVSAAGGGRMTETGLSLGTPHYMSPEQASADRDLSARSDVYSLGCVLYEMIAGQPPHTGPSAQSVLVRILTETPRPLTDLRHTVPPHVAAVVTKAIEKLPADRFQTAGEFMEALEDPAFTYTRAPRTEAPEPRRAPAAASRPGSGTFYVLAAAFLVAVGAALWGWLRPRPDQPARWAHVVLDSLGEGFGPLAALSPDGSTIAYVGSDARLWVRRLSSPDARPLVGTDSARAPFFSPDGRSLGFHRGRSGNRVSMALWTVSLDGSPPVQVARDSSGGVYPGGAWSGDGFIYYVNFSGELLRVPAEGGSPQLLADTTQGYFAWPQPLRGGAGVLVSVGSSRSGFEGMGLYSPKRGKVEPLLGNLSGDQLALYGKYAGGYLFWVNAGRTLMAARFEPSSRKLDGKPVALAPAITPTGGGSFDFTIAGDGTLLYSRGGNGVGTNIGGESIGWVDRSGKATPLDPRLVTDSSDFDFARLSPDGRYVATQLQVGADNSPGEQHQIWLYDLQQRTFSRLSLDGTENVEPQWLDRRTVAYVSDREPGRRAIWAQRVDGSPPSLLARLDRDILDFSPVGRDGGFVVTVPGDSARNRDVRYVPPGDSSSSRPLAATRFDERAPDVSPDGRWVAYVSDVTGRSEVYVRRIDGTGRAWPISTDGGSAPRWSPDGKELFYLALPNELSVATIELGQEPRVISRTPLFPAEPRLEVFDAEAEYDVSAGGDSILSVLEASGSQQPSARWMLGLDVFQALKAREER